MTAHDVRLTRAAQLVAAPQQPARHPLTGLSTERLARRLVVYNPAWDEVPPLLMRARREIAQLTTADVVHRVISQNPDSFWAIARRGEYGAQRRSAEGFFAFLLLNEEGAERLIDGTLDTGDPDPALLAAQSEKPAAIYLWAGHARGALTGANSPGVRKALHASIPRRRCLFACRVGRWPADTGSDRLSAGCELSGTSPLRICICIAAPIATPTTARFMTATAAVAMPATFR